jgi:catechol 2,3-dioxygenase-like lactoylglutathione lyase family enzyme
VTERPRLVALELAADPEPWRAAGFAVDGAGRVRLGTTDLLLRGAQAGSGILGWTIAGAIPADDGLDGLPTTAAPAADAPAPAAPQPNSAAAIDHVVVATPDTARTFEALEAAGFALRRVRDAGTPERPLRQGFLLFSDVLLEVVGPPEPAPGTESAPAAFWGLTLVVDDLAAAAAAFGEHLGPPRDAVQAGRQIAVVAREAGLGLRVALMTPR